MNAHIRQVIRKVLNAATNAPNFFNLSDAERLNWMIGQAYVLGLLASSKGDHARRRLKGEAPCPSHAA